MTILFGHTNKFNLKYAKIMKYSLWLTILLCINFEGNQPKMC